MKKLTALVIARVFVWLAVVALLGSPLFASGSKGSRSTTKSTRAKMATNSTPRGASAKKTVPVHTYKRKDGTVVKAHDRSAPGTKSTSTSAKSSSKTSVPKASTVAARDGNGRIKRSAVARKEFMKETGYPKGRKGYVVDHITPLECGGVDAPSNMQWQTAEEAKIKDRTERNCRRE